MLRRGSNCYAWCSEQCQAKNFFHMLNCLHTLKLNLSKIYFASFVCSWSTSAIRLKKLPSRLLYWNVTTSDARFQRIFTLFQNGRYCCNWEQFHLKKAFLKLRGLVAFEQLRLIALLVSFLKAFKTQNSAMGQISTFWHRYPDIIVDCSFVFSLNTNYMIEFFGVCKVEKNDVFSQWPRFVHLPCPPRS